ncbi:MAG: histidinol dehydrogenase [Desulfurococcales archaeon]|nr:histidinol dehydrogenase [Desulfurococcales archaeon]
MEIVLVDARSGLLEAVRRIRRAAGPDNYLEKVEPIVRDVSSRCYEAVKDYSERFDGVSFEDPTITRSDAALYEAYVSEEFLDAAMRIVERVKGYSKALMPGPVKYNGIRLRWEPIEKVAVYVPGGLNPYPSTAIMAVVPAQVAGVREIYVLTPPCKGCKGKADPRVVVASFLAGASRVYAVGGPQAIAGVAYACKPLPGVYKVVGPGSPYVQAAKLLVSHIVGIDMVAGPTELFIIADSSADPRRLAAEAMAQGEHGPSSVIVLASPDKSVLAKTRDIIRESYRRRGSYFAPVYLLLTSSIEEAVKASNLLAPEHLLLETSDPEGLIEEIRNAGIVSIGVPTAYIDYAAGPSHVLPTSGAALWRGGLTVYDFLKPVQIVEGLDREALEAARVMARSEGFKFHESSMAVG